eukprot:g35534.t1
MSEPAQGGLHVFSSSLERAKRDGREVEEGSQLGLDKLAEQKRSEAALNPQKRHKSSTMASTLWQEPEEDLTEGGELSFMPKLKKRKRAAVERTYRSEATPVVKEAYEQSVKKEEQGERVK